MCLFWPSITVTGITRCRFVFLLTGLQEKAETWTVDVLRDDSSMDMS